MSVKESTEVKSFTCMKISGCFSFLLKLLQKFGHCSPSNCSAVCCEPREKFKKGMSPVRQWERGALQAHRSPLQGGT